MDPAPRLCVVEAAFNDPRSAFRVRQARREIYLPWAGFNDVLNGIVVHGAAWAQAEEVACALHPAWPRLSPGVRRLHTRSIFQVLGATLDRPSQFVLFWAPEVGGVVQGGTRTAVVLAQQHAIPCFNLRDPATRARLERFVATQQ